MTAATLAVQDEDEARAEEDWYTYQVKISEVDKSQIEVFDKDNKRELCRHCGYPKKIGDGASLFMVEP